MRTTDIVKNSAAHYLALGGGIALEWYDWAVYGLMAPFVAPHFFPSSDALTSTLSALSVFALGFVVRPISGAIFGPIADRIGHKQMLVWSMSSMALSSLVMGLLPGYDVLGSTAGLLLLAARLLQGVSTGIEMPTANAAAFELGKPGRRGYFFVVVTGSFNLGGSLLASLVGFLTAVTFGNEAMADWGWRVPFIVGGVGGLIVLLIRRNLPHTGAAVVNAEKHVSTVALWRDVWKHRLGVLTIIFVVGGSMLGYYTWVTGLPALAISHFKENSTVVLAISTGLSAILVIAGPITGALADRFGPSRIYFILRILLVPCYFLVLLYTRPGIGLFAVVVIGGGMLMAFNQVFFQYIMVTLVPPRIRATSVGIGYGIAVSVFGGTASYLFVDAQAKGLLWAYSTYGAVVCALSVILYWFAQRGGVSHEAVGAQGGAGRVSGGVSDFSESARTSEPVVARSVR